MVQYLMSRYLGIDKQNEQYRQVSLILIYTISCICITTFYCFYNTVIFDFPRMFYIDLAGTLIGVAALYTLLGLKRVQLASLILMLMAGGIILLVLLERGNQKYSLAWVMVVPVMSIFLLGYLWGAVYSLVYLAIVAFLGKQGLLVWQPSPWDTGSFINVIAIYVLLFMFSCYFEASRRAAYKLLLQSNRKLALLASSDVLTGLRNRRSLEDYLLTHTDTQQYLAIIDVDDFKHINDHFGHNVGDDVLIALAAIMQDCVGDLGLVGRWGGEEFVVIYNASELSEFTRILATLNHKVYQHSFGLTQPVSISIGGCVHIGSDYKASLRAADAALYDVKVSGKNAYKMAGE